MAKIEKTAKTKQYTVEYALEADTKGTYRYGALDEDGTPMAGKSGARLDVGSNAIYVLKSTFPKAPKKITATFDVEM